MARKARQRISYVLPLASSADGHRLGVNGLAVDSEKAVLYSGGRDGVICAWDLNIDLKSPIDRSCSPQASSAAGSATKGDPPTVRRQQVQAHTHWINDIVLARNNEALVSASSDISVKLWRPGAEDGVPPQTLGLHSDYVKCLASPGPQANWVASGGLDRKISLWDLDGAGKKLEIIVGEDESSAKGSVYALAATGSILASGGPESIVRLSDARSGKQITKFLGHTDNIRDVLIAQDGDTIMTASSDQTVKIWSTIAGRCMYTLTMHNDSVWSLYSDHPQLSVFYSSDRSGLVAKTHIRDWAETDDGLSVAVCREHEGVSKAINAGRYIWTATSSSSINRWCDVNTESGVEVPDSVRFNHRASIVTTRSRVASLPQSSSSPGDFPSSKQIPVRSVLRLSNTAPFPMFQKDTDEATLYSSISTRKASDALLEADPTAPVPCQSLPDFSIEGQNGLIKHVLLNDRRRVLTLDTAGEVVMWDLVMCAPITSFGKRHLEDVAPEVNTMETVAHWCAVDTRTGTLTCVLEDNYCFDAEMYADELNLDDTFEFREDQRINLGKWVLRYLFSSLIDEEIRRDERFRRNLLNEKKQTLQRSNAPASISLPQAGMNGWNPEEAGPTSSSTVRPVNGIGRPLATPGLAIGIATPSAHQPSHPAHHTNTLTPTTEESGQLEKTTSQQSLSRTSMDKSGDYFSTSPHPHPPTTPGGTVNNKVSTDGHDDPPPRSPAEGDKEAHSKEGKGVFGNKFRMTFGMKKLGKTQTSESKPTPVDEKSAETDSDSQSTKTNERVVEENFLGVIQRMRHGYEDQISEGAQSVTTAINPSLPTETPVLRPPLATTILIQEDRPDSGGVADLFEGTVGTLGQQADTVEKVAPVWLGDVLLKNVTPMKDIVKVSFILEPYQNMLPPLANDGNNRLNANRMLRARKILSYVAERIEPLPEKPDPDALKPEEYLELYCQNQLIPTTMTLATIRTHVWRGGGDVLLYYKPNGRKEIRHRPLPPSSSTSSDKGTSSEKDVSTQHG